MISSKKHKISQYASAESKQCVCRYCEEHFANKHQVRQHITAVHPKRHEKDFHMQCVQQPFHTKVLSECTGDLTQVSDLTSVSTVT